MPTTSQQYNDTWQGEFIQLMEQLSHADKRPPPEVGSSAKELIYSENKLQLFRYKPLDVKQRKTPILITYALVNRPYIIDLEPKRSLVLRLLEQGYAVYLIDWGYPDSSDCFTSLNDYINGYIHRCVQHVKRNANKKKVDLLGICQGGVLSLCYTALHPSEIRKLITLVTPIDFHSGDNLLNLLTNGMNSNILTNNAGNVSGQLIGQLFNTLKPFQLSREKYRKIKHLISTEESLDTFLRMEKWLNDHPDLTGLAAQEFLEAFYQQNRLHKKNLTINNKAVRLEKIKCPVLNLYATKDHIVTPDSTRALAQHIKPSLYQEQPINGGHIGAFTSLKSQPELIKSLVKWLG